MQHQASSGQAEPNRPSVDELREMTLAEWRAHLIAAWTGGEAPAQADVSGLTEYPAA